MENMLNSVAIILVIIWDIGFLGYNAGGSIHILLLVALIAVILRVIQDNKSKSHTIQYKYKSIKN